MTRVIHYFVAMTLVLTLAACGGGGERSKVVRPPDSGELRPPAHAVGLPDVHGLADWLTDNPAGGVTVPAGEHRDVGGVRFSCPIGGDDCMLAVANTDDTIMVSSTGGMASAEVVPLQAPAVDRIMQSADTILMSDWVFSGAVDLRVQTDCRQTTCTMSAFGGEDEVSLSDFRSDSDGEWPAAEETYRGVSLVRENEISGIDDLLGEITAYGGWLEHNLFMALSATVRDDEAGDESFLFSMSIGDMTGTTPTSVGGRGSWSGVMIGFDTEASEIRGDADVTIADFLDPEVDVAFTNISDLDTGDRRSDMMWEDIPATDGSFGTGSDGDSIQGHFYGPNHQEIGGIFERDHVIGAFGAKRQP